MALLNPGGAIAQFQRNDCSISPVEVIWRGGVHTMPVSLYEEKQSTAEASIFAYELIATVLFDKVYADGKDDTPLRVANWIDLDKQLPSFLETI